MFRTFLRCLFRTLLGIILFILLWLVLAVTLPYFTTGTAFCKTQKKVTIYIESNGVHTDFVMPVKSEEYDWNADFPYADVEVAGPAFEYVSAGWGDKGFFIGTPTWADLKFPTAFKAATGLSSTAMHVSYKRHEPATGESCKRLLLSGDQYRMLVIYIRNSFQHTAGKFIRIDHPGYNSHDCFYEANGTYSLFRTCNVWTGDGLRCIGVNTGLWTPLAGGVLQNLN